MTSISNNWKQLTSILSNLNNFHSLEVVDRVSETQLQVSENSDWIIWRLKGYKVICPFILTLYFTIYIHRVRLPTTHTYTTRGGTTRRRSLASCELREQFTTRQRAAAPRKTRTGSLILFSNLHNCKLTASRCRVYPLRPGIAWRAPEGGVGMGGGGGGSVVTTGGSGLRNASRHCDDSTLKSETDRFRVSRGSRAANPRGLAPARIVLPRGAGSRRRRQITSVSPYPGGNTTHLLLAGVFSAPVYLWFIWKKPTTDHCFIASVV